MRNALELRVGVIAREAHVNIPEATAELFSFPCGHTLAGDGMIHPSGPMNNVVIISKALLF